MVTSMAGGSSKVSVVLVQKHRLTGLEAHLCGQHLCKAVPAYCLCLQG